MAKQTKNQYRPTSISHPGESLKDFLEEREMSQAELAERAGRPKKTINEIIKGKAPIMPDTAIQLERVLGAPASFWMNRQRLYDEHAARQKSDSELTANIDWLQGFNIGELVRAGWIKPFNDKLSQLKELLQFFGVNSPEQWKIVWQSSEAIYRRSPAFEINSKPTSAWLRKGELEAEKLQCASFNQAAFRSALVEMRRLTLRHFDDFRRDLVDKFASVGVAVIFLRPLRGVPVWGVTRWITPSKALIQLSMRGKYEDIFWFTFFHEAGHIIQHGKSAVFMETDRLKDDRENEADEFAQKLLIPQSYWRPFTSSRRHFSSQDVEALARQLEISPAIVVGRLQHEKLLPKTHLNKLRRKYAD
jgi:HTH-type transcriptional regulator/antitoxin HigA